MSPHLFTHLFHTGVIVSTRKLVYDSGSAEEAIKSLMQAQHKAVLKDLRRGQFDDKIDEYLSGTPGLLPRSLHDVADESRRESRPELDRAPATPSPELQRKSPDDLEESTLHDAVAVAVIAANNATDRTVMPYTGEPVYDSGASARAFDRGSTADEPEIEIQLELDDGDDPPRTRTSRDTDLVPDGLLDFHTRPTLDVSAGVPKAPPLGETDRVRSQPSAPPSRPSAGGGLPPAARPLTRPARPAITPPQVVSRPLPADTDGRPRSESDAIEVYAPAPPSAELPVPASTERPGQYSQHKRVSSRTPSVMPPSRDRSGGIAIPPGLGRPGRTASHPAVRPPSAVASPETSAPSSSAVPRPPSVPAQAVPTGRPPEPPTAPTRSPTPGRISPSTRAGSSTNSGVVMTRPAMIVGASAKPVAARVRKAREDEGRGFGQGLISEKSLDEVILAYLSEDADDK